MRETELYPPVKTYLEGQGFEVKGEVGRCDVVARRDDLVVIVELKTALSLALLVQGVERLRLSDHVYIAVPALKSKGRRTYTDILTLCRRLGIGFLTVSSKGLVTAHLDPGPYQPRKSKHRVAALLREFDRRIGDPTEGGTGRGKIMTAYRQDALRCAGHLAQQGASRGADVAGVTGVERATRVMRDNHYGWFEKEAKGIYRLSATGEAALATYADQLKALLPE